MPCNTQLNGAFGTAYASDCGEDNSGEVLGLLNWRITITAKVPEFTANDTSGWEQTSKGSRFTRGSLEVRAHSTRHCPMQEGELYDCVFHLDATGNNYYSQTIRVEEIGEVLVDVDASNNITYPISFKGHGPLVRNGVTETNSASSSGS